MALLPSARLVEIPHYRGAEKALEAAVRDVLEPRVRPFRGGIFAGGEYVDCQSALVLAPPGHEQVGRIFQGRPGLTPGSVAVLATFGRTDAFLSTDRASLASGRRPPVFDRYEALLEPLGPGPDAGFRLVELKTNLRLVPADVSLEALEILQGTPMFQEILSRFGEVPYGTRLVERPRAITQPIGLVRRLFGAKPPPPALPPPPRQLKQYLDRWLPAGNYRFGELFLDTRELKDAPLELSADGLAFTIEFIEGTTPRHVHWRFRGTLMRVVMSEGKIVLAQRFVI